LSKYVKISKVSENGNIE